MTGGNGGYRVRHDGYRSDLFKAFNLNSSQGKFEVKETLIELSDVDILVEETADEIELGSEEEIWLL